MPNQTAIDIFSARSRALKGEATALGTLAHQGVKGTARELLLRQLLSPLLPPQVQAQTGTIIDWGPVKRSERNQDDVVLFNATMAPLLWDEPGCAIMPIQGVVAHIEVKSTLTDAEVKAAVRAAGELVGMGQGTAPASLIFAYASDISGEKTTELDRVLRAIDAHWHPSPGQATSPVQCICVADIGCWLLAEHPTTKQAGWFFVEPQEEREVLAFVSVVSNYLFLRHHSVHGAGAYLLDMAWLQGPVVACPVLVGPAEET